MMKKAILVEPPFYRLYEGGYSLQKYPLALGFLAAAAAEQTSWEVMAYNADFDPDATRPFTNSFLSGKGYYNYRRNLATPVGSVWDEVRRTFEQFHPGVVGISTKTQNFASALVVADIAKEVDSSIVVVVGGPHPSMSPEGSLRCPAIDIAVPGEGEETFVDLLNSLGEGRPLSKVDGILYRDGGTTIRTSPRPYIQGLDALPFPFTYARKVLKDYASYPTEAFGHVFSMRGCPYGCEFCGSREVWSRKIRFRSARNVVSEISALIRAGLRHIHFDDDTFGVDKRFIRELCGLLRKECSGLTWSCEIVVNLIDKETVDIMRQSGCVHVQIGVESGNNNMLRTVNKATTIERSMAAASLLRDSGMAVDAFFMAGFPYETEESLFDTWRAIREIEADVIIFSIFTPYPGTDAFEVCSRNGLVSDSYDVSLYNHQSPVNCFTINIPKARFREIVSDMQQDVDARNRRNKVKRLISHVRNRGLLSTVKKAARYGVKHRFGS